MNFYKRVIELALSNFGVCMCIGTSLVVYGINKRAVHRLFDALEKRGIHIKRSEISVDENALIQGFKSLSNEEVSDFIEKIRRDK